MIRRVTDSEELAVLAASCGLPGSFDDGTPYLERANAVGWGSPLRGAFLLDPLDERSAIGHLMVHPEHRGREAFEAGRATLAFLKRIGLVVVGVTPRARRDALAFVRAVGMRIAGETHEHIYSIGGAHG